MLPKTQIRKTKTRKEKANKEDSIKNLNVDVAVPEVENEIIKTVYYDIKPMTPGIKVGQPMGSWLSRLAH